MRSQRRGERLSWLTCPDYVVTLRPGIKPTTAIFQRRNRFTTKTTSNTWTDWPESRCVIAFRVLHRTIWLDIMDQLVRVTDRPSAPYIRQHHLQLLQVSEHRLATDDRRSIVSGRCIHCLELLTSGSPVFGFNVFRTHLFQKYFPDMILL